MRLVARCLVPVWVIASEGVPVTRRCEGAGYLDVVMFVVVAGEAGT